MEQLKGRVLIFSLPTCPSCRRAKAKLNDLGIPFEDVNVHKYPERGEEIRERTGRKTVPQIFFNAIHVGGWDDFSMIIENGKLDDLLSEVENNEPPDDAPKPVPEESSEEDRKTPPPGPYVLSCEISDEELAALKCEPDEYAHLVREIKQSGLVKDHKYHLRTYKNCFVGRELVNWLMKRRGGKLRMDAIQMGRELVKRHFCRHVTEDHDFKDEYLFYRFVEDSKRNALNMEYVTECEPYPANVVAEHLRGLILQLYGEFLSADGRGVNYSGMGKSSKFAAYVKATAQLQRVDVSRLNRSEKIAFFVNIYNALVIHANVSRGPPTNLWQRYKFFNYTSYVIGGYIYSLQDIENGVLRANRKGVGQLKRPFKRNDPRAKISLVRHEPRIHFALVCGAKSCPPIKTYSAENIESELQLASEAFFEGGGCVIDMRKKEISLSAILKWYKIDFGINTEEVLKWIAAHMSAGTTQTNLLKCIQEKSYKVSYQHYNWDLNSS
ncbi:uncharacterized protein [Oscarella lobularis]|uniref:uncharacterized protein n=1 Tax=Oscarella lobularis TaxID=121494 RepID=UPI00331427C7